MSIGILPNVNSTKNESGCEAGDKCLFFPHHKVEEQANKKPKKRATSPSKTEETATTKMQWLLWKLYLRWVASRKTRSYWTLKEANEPGETRCKKSWDRFEEYDSLSLRYVKHNQIRSRKRAFKNGKSEDQSAVAIVKNCTTIGVRLARLRTIRISKGNKASG